MLPAVCSVAFVNISTDIFPVSKSVIVSMYVSSTCFCSISNSFNLVPLLVNSSAVITYASNIPLLSLAITPVSMSFWYQSTNISTKFCPKSTSNPISSTSFTDCPILASLSLPIVSFLLSAIILSFDWYSSIAMNPSITCWYILSFFVNPSIPNRVSISSLNRVLNLFVPYLVDMLLNRSISTGLLNASARNSSTLLIQ